MFQMNCIFYALSFDFRKHLIFPLIIILVNLHNIQKRRRSNKIDDLQKLFGVISGLEGKGVVCHLEEDASERPDIGAGAVVVRSEEELRWAIAEGTGLA